MTERHQYQSRSKGRTSAISFDLERISSAKTHPLCLVVVRNGVGLLVVGLKALAQGIGVVIRALDQRLACDVVGHGLLGGTLFARSTRFSR